MSLDVWLSRGKKIQVGGRELLLMPLPLSKLVKIGQWLEDNCNEVTQEIITELRAGKEAPNLPGMITKVLLKINLSDVALELFSFSKDNNGEPVNKDLTKEFFDDNLDIPVAHDLFNKFVEVNALEALVKNLQSLPIAKKMMDFGLSTFGIPYLNFLQQSMASRQSRSEGSPIPKSTDTSVPAISEKLDPGSTEDNSQAVMEKKQYVQ